MNSSGLEGGREMAMSHCKELMERIGKTCRDEGDEAPGKKKGSSGWEQSSNEV